MSDKPCIRGMLDTDLYKVTMQQAVFMLYPEAEVEYTFINRSQTPLMSDHFQGVLHEQLQAMADFSLTDAEERFLREKCYYLNPAYIDFLKGYRYNPDEVEIGTGRLLEIKVRGPWYRTILWEVPILALVSELNYRNSLAQEGVSVARENIAAKAKEFELMGIKVAEFGTRRRFSYDIQRLVVEHLAGWGCCIGTSNIHLAHLCGLTPIGTQAHEWFMFHAAKFGFRMANAQALKQWVKVYQGELGIALSDTFTSDAFFQAFTTLYAKLFDGVRHDSGCPFEFTDKVLEHYKRLHIDPTTKNIVYSDGISSLDQLRRIHSYQPGPFVRKSYGIGTWLTNDVGAKPLNIVIKMTAAKPCGMEWIPTCKLSDSPGKHTGLPETIKLCKQVLRIA